MPTLSKPSTDWAHGIAKSLRKHLNPKLLKRRFSNKARIYAASTGEESSTKAPSKKSKPKPEKKKPVKKPETKLCPVNSVGVQASLPSRSLFNELSHEGSVDVMSYMNNSNFNNSVDSRRVSSLMTSTTPAKSTGKWIILCSYMYIHCTCTCTCVHIINLG